MNHSLDYPGHRSARDLRNERRRAGRNESRIFCRNCSSPIGLAEVISAWKLSDRDPAVYFLVPSRAAETAVTQQQCRNEAASLITDILLPLSCVEVEQTNKVINNGPPTLIRSNVTAQSRYPSCTRGRSESSRGTVAGRLAMDQRSRSWRASSGILLVGGVIAWKNCTGKLWQSRDLGARPGRRSRATGSKVRAITSVIAILGRARWDK